MAKGFYVGINNVARKIKEGYVGVAEKYTQVEYIESTGTQYIDTGFTPNQDTKIVIDMQGGSSAAASGTQMFYGVGTSPTFQFGKSGSSSWGIRAYYGTTYSDVLATWDQASFKSTRRTIVQDKNKIEFDGISHEFTYAEFSCDYTMYLFGVNSSSGFTFATSMKIYSCQIYDNGILIRDFVPVINSSGEAGLYDLANNVFYTNAGTDTFAVGNSTGVLSIEDSNSSAIARRIKEAFIGIGGIARPCWSSGELAYYGTITGLSQGRYGLSAASIGNYALFAGGFYSPTSSRVATVDAYDESLTLTTPTVLSEIGYYLASANVGNYALFGGGHTGSSYSSRVNAYDKSLTRTIATALSAGRFSLSAASVGSYALFGGGSIGTNTYLSTVDAYNESLTRTTATDLSVGRFILKATSIGSYVLFGGGTDDFMTGLSTVDAYNESLTRTTATELSAGRFDLAAISMDNYALFGGGYTGSSSAVVDAYNKSLTRSIPTELSVARHYLAAATVGDYAIFGGGRNFDIGYYSTVDAYDKSLTRAVSADLSLARCELAAASVGNYALFCGGYNGSSSVTTVDAYVVA